MKLVFTSPNIRHAESTYYDNISNDTIEEVAAKLEEHYALIQQFTEDNEHAIMDIVVKNKLEFITHKIPKSQCDENISYEVLDMFKAWIHNAETPYMSKRALETNGVTFVDTGEYVGTMEVIIEE